MMAIFSSIMLLSASLLLLASIPYTGSFRTSRRRHKRPYDLILKPHEEFQETDKEEKKP